MSTSELEAYGDLSTTVQRFSQALGEIADQTKVLKNKRVVEEIQRRVKGIAVTEPIRRCWHWLLHSAGTCRHRSSATLYCSFLQIASSCIAAKSKFGSKVSEVE